MLDISELKIPHTFYICENLTESVILGRTFLADASAVIDFKNRTITVSDTVQIPLLNKISRDNFVRAKEPVCIEPNSEVIFPVQCHTKFNNRTVLLTPIPGEQFRRFAVANAICRVDNGRTVCRLFNCTDKCLVICANQKIAQAELFDDFERCLLISKNDGSQSDTNTQTPEVDDATLEQFANDYQFDINKDLSPELRKQLLRVLFRRKEAFAKSVKDLKSYNKEQFEVKLKSTRPLIQRQFKHKPLHNRILQQLIDEWKEADIVEESPNYFFRNPIFLVPKASLKGAKDPTDASHYRPVIDMRALNQRVEKLVTFCPSPSDLIQEVTGSSGKSGHQKFYSTFDLCSGFLQLTLKPGISRECFSFISPEGQNLMFKKVPFGYVNSPHHFNSMMMRITAPLRATGSFCCYFDDSMLHTASAEEHIKLTDQFLSILIENGLKCSTKKSSLMYNNIRFLGVDIGPEGISVPKDITRTLDRLQTMKISTTKHVQKVLGFLNYWRAHIPNLAARTFNLRQLIKKDAQPFRFTEECEKERLDVLGELRSPHVLQPIRSDEVLYLFVDSSFRGVGLSVAQANHPPNDSQAVQKELVHIRKGQPRLHPCMHMSWAVGPAQRNLNSTALELWGLQRALLALGHLATGRQIHVISDNIGLTSFTNLRIGNARERRLLAFLQMYDLQLHYCPGNKHVSSDFLSRFISDLPPAQRVEFQPPNDEQAIDDYLFAVSTEATQPSEQFSQTSVQQKWTAYLIDKQTGDVPLNTVNIVTSNSYQRSQAQVLDDNSKYDKDVNDSYMQKNEVPYLSRHSEELQSAEHQPTPLQSVVMADNLNVKATPFVPVNSCVVVSNEALNVDSKHGEDVSSHDDLENQHTITVSTDGLMHDRQLPCHNGETIDTVNANRRLRKKATQPTSETPQNSAEDTPDSSQDSPPSFQPPKLLPEHYINDPEFSHIWKFLSANELSGHRQTDYKTMIVAPLYVIEDEKLYRFAMPRSQKRSADGPIRKVLAIPQAFQQSSLLEIHHIHGHCSAQRLFETARLHIYFKTLYAACTAVATTCPTCQQVKIDRRKQIPELHPLPLFPLGTVFLLDHKMLPRKTSEGHVAILVMVESYSGFTYLEPVHDLTALTTAKALIRRVLPHHLNLRGLISDKGSAFIANIFKIITRKLLNLYTWTSASLHAQSHGQVENIIGQVNKLLPIYASQDSEIADALPILEIVLRTSISKPRAYCPYEILYGQTPNLKLMGEPVTKDTPIPPVHQYVTWLKDRLIKVQQDVSQNLQHARAQQKASFDRRNRVSTPSWKVGDLVYLEKLNPPPGSNKVLTHRKFVGPYFITKLVQRPAAPPSSLDPYPLLSQTEVPVAYELTHAQTGKVLKSLVPSKRLKKCFDKTHMNKIWPPLTPPRVPSTQNDQSSSAQTARGQPQSANDTPNSPTANNSLPPDWEVAKAILRKRVRRGVTEFLVKFQDNSAYWCTDVSDELKRRFFLKLANERNRRRRAANKRFDN
jgi:hypothetical protein